MNCPVLTFCCLEKQTSSQAFFTVTACGYRWTKSFSSCLHKSKQLKKKNLLFIHAAAQRPAGKVGADLCVDTVLHFCHYVCDLRTHDLLLISIISAPAKAWNTWHKAGSFLMDLWMWCVNSTPSRLTASQERICDKMAGQTLPLWCRQVVEKHMDSPHETGQVHGAPRNGRQARWPRCCLLAEARRALRAWLSGRRCCCRGACLSWICGFWCPAVVVSASWVKEQIWILQKTSSISPSFAAKIHEGGDASGSQVFPDEPLGAVPVETLCWVSDPRKMHTRFVGGKRLKGLLVAEITEGEKTPIVIVNMITVFYTACSLPLVISCSLE